ncbi:MAG TPA: glycosyltransferase family 2 protein [Acetobacteraceae bacterium]
MLLGRHRVTRVIRPTVSAPYTTSLGQSELPEASVGMLNSHVTTLPEIADSPGGLDVTTSPPAPDTLPAPSDPARPKVSVVIPTRGRPQLLLRALQSALTQTLRQIEVIVVVDGPDDDTVVSLRAISDARLRVIVNPRSLSAAGARNAGVEHARGEWIALLDDDDEWLPHKLERQISFAVLPADVLIGCLSRVITPLATYVWPEEIYDGTVPLGDYLFDRRTMFAGSSFIQTSSYLLRRETFRKSPFRLCTPHDDWDFLLRLSRLPGAEIKIVPEVLVNVYFEERRPSLGSTNTWRESLSWLDDIAPLLSRRAYSGFCLGVIGSRAAHEQAFAAFALLLRKALANGSPSLRQALVYLAFWAIPQTLRRQVRAVFRGRPLPPGHADSSQPSADPAPARTSASASRTPLTFSVISPPK